MTSTTRTTVSVTSGVGWTNAFRRDRSPRGATSAIVSAPHRRRQWRPRGVAVGHGELDRVSVEGTHGTYGAALARHLRRAGILIVEVDRPDRRARRSPIRSAGCLFGARAVWYCRGRTEATRRPHRGDPRASDGRLQCRQSRSQATNQLRSLIVTGPPQLPEQLRHLLTLKLMSPWKWSG